MAPAVFCSAFSVDELQQPAPSKGDVQIIQPFGLLNVVAILDHAESRWKE
jgi:hypothetical protein